MNSDALTTAELVACGLDPEQAGEWLRALNKQAATKSPEQVWQWCTRQVLTPAHPFQLHERLWAHVFADWEVTCGLPPAWIPDEPEASNLGQLMREMGKATFAELYQWSIRERAAFWETMIRRLGVQFAQPYETVLATADDPDRTAWLVGAKLNIVASCFQRADSEPAIVTAREGGALRTVSVGELKTLAAQVRHGLAELGLEPGNRVAIYMPMTVEAVAIYLGALAGGFPVVTIADSFSVPEITQRLHIGRVQCAFTQDVAVRAGKRLPLYDKLRQADEVRAIVLPGSTEEVRLQQAPDQSWTDFLSQRTDLCCRPTAPDDLTTILFSSGTTGTPKAIPWTQTTPLKAAIDAHLHQDVRPEDTVCWPTNMGWMMGPWLVFASLMNRATMALFDGAPTSSAFLQFVQESQVSVLGVVPSLVAAWRAGGDLARTELSTVRLFSSTGECSNPRDMFWLMSRAGYRPLIEYCGGTEVGGGYIASTVVQSNVPSTFTTPTLGTELVLWDEDRLSEEQGEVFLVPPTIGFSQSLLNGDHHAIYYAGTPHVPEKNCLRRHGDRWQRFANGNYRALGRTDDAMNLGGIKVGSREIEDVVTKLPACAEVAAIAVPPPGGGPDRLVLFVVLAGDVHPDAAELQAAAQVAIRQQLNPLFKVHDVVTVDQLPRTASNKVMRRVLREEYERRP